MCQKYNVNQSEACARVVPLQPLMRELPGDVNTFGLDTELHFMLKLYKQDVFALMALYEMDVTIFTINRECTVKAASRYIYLSHTLFNMTCKTQ